VIVDDAHATTEGQFRLTIPIGHAAFYPLFDLFADDLKEQNRKATFDADRRTSSTSSPPAAPPTNPAMAHPSPAVTWPATAAAAPVSLPDIRAGETRALPVARRSSVIMPITL
jgi:hypothetical protein